MVPDAWHATTGGMGVRLLDCIVCRLPTRADIDAALVDPRNSMTALAIKAGVARQTMRRHRDLHLSVDARTLRVHQELRSSLDVTSASSELERLYLQAQADGDAARQNKDLRTALRSIEVLTRVYELQARLVADAASRRRSDVTQHPAWLAVSGVIMTALRAHPDAERAVALAIERELGVGGGLPPTPAPVGRGG